MAVVSAVSDVRIDDNATHSNFREWTATAQVSAGGATQQDYATGATFNIRVAMTTGGLTPPDVPDTLTLEVIIDNGSTIVKSFPLTPGTVTQDSSFSMTQNGTGGGNRYGTLRMNVHAARTGSPGGVTNYDIDCDNRATGNATQSRTTHNQGFVRATTTAVLHVNHSGTPSNTDDTNTYEFRDPISVRAVLDAGSAALPYDTAKTITLNVTKSVGSLTATPTPTGGTAFYENNFAGACTAANFGAQPAQVTFTSTVSAPVSGIQNADLATGLGFTTFTSNPSKTITVDTRLTFSALSTTGLPSSKIINFGLHQFSASFQLLTARTNTAITEAITIKSWDHVGGAAEGAFAGAATGPTYSFSNASISGPTVAGNRHTGPNGDTASHTIAGKSKDYQITINTDSSNTQHSDNNGFAVQFNLSDLLRLTVHPQTTQALNAPADPYNDTTRNNNYIISADQLFLFGFVGDVNKVAVSGINCAFSIFDPANNASPDSPKTAATAASGFTSPAQKFGVIAPSGTWTLRNWVDFTQNIGTYNGQGNYGDTDPASGIATIGSQITTVSFISAFRGNYVLEASIAQFPSGNTDVTGLPIRIHNTSTLRDQLQFHIRARKSTSTGQDATNYHFDSGTTPQFKILLQNTNTTFGGPDYEYWQTGVKNTTDPGPVNFTGTSTVIDGSGIIGDWTHTYTIPSSDISAGWQNSGMPPGNYILLVSGIIDGAVIHSQVPFTVGAYDPQIQAILDVNTGSLAIPGLSGDHDAIAPLGADITLSAVLFRAFGSHSGNQGDIIRPFVGAAHTLWVLRFRIDLDYWEVLDASGNTWTKLSTYNGVSTGVPYANTLDQSTTDATFSIRHVFLGSLVNQWFSVPISQLIFVARVYSAELVPYVAQRRIIVTGASHPHSHDVFDPVGIFK